MKKSSINITLIPVDQSIRVHVVTISLSHYNFHLAAGILKLRQYLLCRRHTAHSSDNKTNENLNHQDVESGRVCETVSCASSRSLARSLVLSFCLRGSLPVPLLRNRAIMRRFHAERFPGRHPQRTGDFGDGGRARTNLAAVGPFPPFVRSKRARDFCPASIR